MFKEIYEKGEDWSCFLSVWCSETYVWYAFIWCSCAYAATGVLISPQPDQEGNKLGRMSGTRAISTTSRRELSSSCFSCKARHQKKFTLFWQKY